jgi:U3 small nucleolar RNA-associated protein 14
MEEVIKHVVPKVPTRETNENNLDVETGSLKSETEKMFVSLTQEELLKRAFCCDAHEDIEDQFHKEKQFLAERDVSTIPMKKTSIKSTAGWGSWTGHGSTIPKKRLEPTLSKPMGREPPSNRKRGNDKKPNVIINEKRIKKTANNYLLANVPYPFTSRDEYERSVTGGIGQEWNATSGFKNMTRPEISTRYGKIIKPISKREKETTKF